MNDAEKALEKWIETQFLAVSDIEQHGFIEGYKWAIKELKEAINDFCG